ncbi:MAG: S1 RNA-binding domain-containing protein [Clostridia bacterium]|nr:S1 RNA-binding domain-containing protein [Clostridia bacterium]
MEFQNVYKPEGYLIDTDQNKYYTSSLHMLEKAMKNGIILEGIAKMCDCTNMSLRLDFGFCHGIIPRDEAMTASAGSKDIAIISRVGKPVCFKVKAIIRENGNPVAILSRKAAQEECESFFISRLTPGDIIPSVVTHLDSFGAFVDIGCGIISLMCIDSISVSRIFHPSDRLKAGQRIMAVVKSRDYESGRIYMSLRELLGTWEENASAFTPLSTVPGIVRSIESYGIFVELSPNLAGLAEVRSDVYPGDHCSVYIKNILPERMKVKLVIIDTCSVGTPPPLKYYIDTNTVHHLSRWRYSPESSNKVVESIFE